LTAALYTCRRRRMHQPNLSVAIVALVLFSACGTSGTGDVTTTDSAGVAIITSVAVDRPLPWTLTEELRIGGADSGAGSFTAASPSLVQADGDNRIVVFDRDRNVIEV